MRILLAPDKFKGSLTAMEFCTAVEKGLLEVIPNAEISKLPLADGGDGTIDVVNFYLKGKTVTCEVNDPFFRPVKATYLYAENQNTAFIEMAEASGIKLLQAHELDCKNATTFGTGELIKDAIDRGAQTIILGIGGSATNDCGIGMATALGYRFLDGDKKGIEPIGKYLSQIRTIDDCNSEPKLRDVKFKIACDVTNPLYGKNGAAYVYAAQKGASIEDLKILDQGLKNFSKILKKKYQLDPQRISGAGAAGGMGIASRLFLNGELISGIALMMQLANFEEHLQNSDWVITGEGKLDTQTLSGKTINGVVEKAKEKAINVAAFCGANELNKKELTHFGIHYVESVMDRAIDFADALENSHTYLVNMAKDFSINYLRED